MKRLVLLMIWVSGTTLAQQPDATEDYGGDNNKLPFKERIYVGGDANVFFSTTYSIFSISPIVGYKINDELSVGVGGKYQWLKDRYYDFTDHMYGGSVFSRYLIGSSLLAHAEYELLNVRDYRYYYTTNQISRTWASMFFVGAGYRQGFGGSYFTLMLLYDLIDHPNSPYRYQYVLPGVPLVIRGGLVISL